MTDVHPVSKGAGSVGHSQVPTMSRRRKMLTSDEITRRQHQVSSSSVTAAASVELQNQAVPHVMVNGNAYPLMAVRSNLAGKSYRLASSVLPPELANVQLPLVLDRRQELPPIRDQGMHPICGGITGATVLEWKHFQKTGQVSPLLSAECIYESRLNQSTGGMSGYDIVNLIEHHGTCLDQTWQAWKQTRTSEHWDEVMVECQKHRVRHDVLVDSVNILKVALQQNGACMFFVPCYGSGPTFWKPESPMQTMPIGGHALTAVGYDDNQRVIILRNSWGKQWADGGYTYFPYDDWNRWHWEAWTCIGDTVSSTEPMISAIPITSNSVPVAISSSSPRTSDLVTLPEVIAVIITDPVADSKHSPPQQENESEIQACCTAGCVIQ